jgi:penicillin-binding protein 2
VVIEHGMGGARAAAPVAKDVMTYLFNKDMAMEALLPLEQQWGGTIAERMAAAPKPGRRPRSASRPRSRRLSRGASRSSPRHRDQPWTAIFTAASWRLGFITLYSARAAS